VETEFGPYERGVPGIRNILNFVRGGRTGVQDGVTGVGVPQHHRYDRESISKRSVLADRRPARGVLPASGIGYATWMTLVRIVRPS
jgi:hypothetical protein